jgi:hypothetical protein
LQAAQAGYASKKGLPAPVIAEAPVVPDPTPAADAPAVVDTPEAVEQVKEEPPAPTAVTAQLEVLKAQIREMKAGGTDKATIDRLFGEIGGITRAVKQLQKKDAPAENDLAGAMAAAEKVAADYPEIGKPMLNALKAMASQLPAKADEQDEPAPQTTTSASPYSEKQLALIEALDGIHPDRLELNESPDFKKWLTAQGREYEEKFKRSWDFALLANGYSNFKQSKQTAAAQAAAAAAEKAKRAQEKKDRLDAAETPSGVAGQAVTTISDDEAARRGYERGRRKRL